MFSAKTWHFVFLLYSQNKVLCYWYYWGIQLGRSICFVYNLFKTYEHRVSVLYFLGQKNKVLCIVLLAQNVGHQNIYLKVNTGWRCTQWELKDFKWTWSIFSFSFISNVYSVQITVIQIYLRVHRGCEAWPDWRSGHEVSHADKMRWQEMAVVRYWRIPDADRQDLESDHRRGPITAVFKISRRNVSHADPAPDRHTSFIWRASRYCRSVPDLTTIPPNQTPY